MTEKRGINKLLLSIVVISVLCLSLLMCTDRDEAYKPISELPQYQPDSKALDGDTQVDTIKALQAYAKEAVGKAKALSDKTEASIQQVHENANDVSKLETEVLQAKQERLDATSYLKNMENRLNALKTELGKVKDEQRRYRISEDAFAVGQNAVSLGNKAKANKGQWYEPVDRIAEAGQEDSRLGFSGLLSRSNRVEQKPSEKEVFIEVGESLQNEPAYTIPKDATLTDALAMTALIGRIPVDGQTPDPYPVKIYIGRENLLANGHALPEIEGMVFSGLGFGDWNLSCVSARLYSATFIFEDGSIVNHSDSDTPLGYISDPSGVPCVSGRLVTNAPQFIAQRLGLVGLGTAGAAYAEAQTQTQVSPVTGTTTTSIIGEVEKLVAGDVVNAATDEVSRWLLERQEQSFDAVVVDPGVEVSVHLDRSLNIDLELEGRKIRYARQRPNHPGDLD